MGKDAPGPPEPARPGAGRHRPFAAGGCARRAGRPVHRVRGAGSRRSAGRRRAQGRRRGDGGAGRGVAVRQVSALATAAGMTATVSALPLSLGAPYVAQFLEPTLAGTLNAALGVNWVLGANVAALQKEKGTAFDLKLRLDRLTLDKLALSQGRQLLASIQNVELVGGQINPVGQSVALGKVAVTNPKLKIERDAQGRWMVEQWLKGDGKTAAPGSPAAKETAAHGRWRSAISCSMAAALGWADAATPRPVAFEVSALRVQVQSRTRRQETGGPGGGGAHRRWANRARAAQFPRHAGPEPGGHAGRGGTGEPAGPGLRTVFRRCPQY